MILLYLPQLQLSPGFSKLWTAVLHALTAAHASGSEVLAEAVPEALKNALLMMHDMVSRVLLMRGFRACVVFGHASHGQGGVVTMHMISSPRGTIKWSETHHENMHLCMGTGI